MLGIHRAKGTPHALPDGSLRLGGNLLPHNMVHHGRKQVCIHLAIHPAHLGNHRPKFFIFAAQVFRFFLPVLKVHGLSFPVFFSCSVCWFLRLSCHHYTMLCAVWASAAKAYFLSPLSPDTTASRPTVEHSHRQGGWLLLGNTAQFPPCGLSTAPAVAARHLRYQNAR